MPSRFGRRRHIRRTVLAAAALAYCIGALIARQRPLTNILELVVAVSAPYAPLVALFAFALSVVSRRKLMSAAAILVVSATIAVQVPWYYLGRPADVGRGVVIRLLSSNLRKGQADASFFVALAQNSADVVVVSELTPEGLRRFSQAGIDDEFHHSLLLPLAGAGGIGLWSRYPLAPLSPTEHRYIGVAAARMRVPGVQVDPLIASVHVTSPFAHNATFDQWRSAITATKAQLEDFADTVGPGAIVVAGDYNCTPDMWQFRDLLTTGYRDSVQQTGSGFGPTFPSHRWGPPVITIDHILTRQAATDSIQTIKVPGSDHRALLASITIPIDPTSS